MEKKTSDCVEMRREGSRRIHEAIQTMTVEEELAYWRAAAHELETEWQAVRQALAHAPQPSSSPQTVNSG
jgi:hypothetical protein